MASETKTVKDLGWDKISLSQKGFKGAIQSYKTENGGKVALAFNMHEAFIVEDAQGLFGVADLDAGLIKAKGIDIEHTGEIEGAETLAWHDEDTDEVSFAEDRLTALGINAFEVKESLKTRLLALSKLDKMVDMAL
jgi:hypothetical protein